MIRTTIKVMIIAVAISTAVWVAIICDNTICATESETPVVEPYELPDEPYVPHGADIEVEDPDGIIVAAHNAVYEEDVDEYSGEDLYEEVYNQGFEIGYAMGNTCVFESEEELDANREYNPELVDEDETKETFLQGYHDGFIQGLVDRDDDPINVNISTINDIEVVDDSLFL